MTNNPIEPDTLTPALRELLQASITNNTTSTDELADIMCLSPHTVHTSYKRICGLLHVHSRSAAVIVALKRGDITFSLYEPSAPISSPEVDPPPPNI